MSVSGRRRRAGTQTVNPSADIAPGETLQVPLAHITGGPRNQEGYLRKYLPFQAVVVDSYNSEKIQASLTGQDYDPVPANTARTFDSVKVHQVYLKNPASNSGTVASNDIDLILFNTEESVNKQPGFSLGQAVEDILPGFSFGVRTE